MAEIDRLCASPLQIESAEQIQNILPFLQLSEDLSKHLDSFIQILSSSQSSDKLRFVLKPILPVGVHEADVFRFCLSDSFCGLCFAAADIVTVNDFLLILL